MSARRGRALGPGRLVLLRRGKGKGPAQWTLFWTDAKGDRRRKALSTQKHVAQRLQSHIIAQRDLQAAGLGSVEGQSMPLDELLNHYLEDLATRATGPYHYNARMSLRRTLDALRAKRVRDVRPIEVIQYRNRIQRDENLSNTTCNGIVGLLSAMLNWATKCGLIAENPIRNIGRLPEGEKHLVRPRRAMSDEEIARFLEGAREDDRQQAAYIAAETTIANGTRGPGYAAKQRRERIPQATLWRTYLETGARYFELVSVTWADVELNPERGTMRLRATTTKSGKQRFIPLLYGLVADLRALRAIHARLLGSEPQDGDRVFLTPEGKPWPKASRNVMRLFDRVCALAKIERVTVHGERLDVHALRHTAASRLARLGVDMDVTRRILGHADARMTSKVYVHLDTQDLREALEAAGGVATPAAPRLVQDERALERTEASA